MTRNSKEDEDILWELAKDLINSHQWQKARLIMQQLVIITPHDPAAHYSLGLAWLGLNDLKKAETCFRRAMNNGDTSVQTLLSMANICSYRGDFKGQLEWGLRAAKISEDSPEPYFVIAEAQSRLGQLAEAERTLKNIIDIHPKNIQAHRMLGDVYLSLQNLDNASMEFFTAISYDPKDADLWTIFGHTLSRKKKYDQAIYAFETALYLKPDDPLNNYNIGDTYLALGHPEKAISALTKSVQLNPNYSLGYYDLGLAYFGIGKYEECATASEAALRSDPDMSIMQTNLGIGATTSLGLAYLNLRKYSEAEQCFRRNLKIIESTYFNLGLTLFKQKRYEESLVYLLRALETNPNDSEYLDILGNIYSELEQFDEALKSFDLAIAIDASYSLAYYDKGTVLAKMKGKQAAAIKMFARAIDLNPNLFWAYYAIACIYALKGKQKLALNYLNQAFQKGFNDISYLENDADWESLRTDPQFLELKHKYANC